MAECTITPCARNYITLTYGGSHVDLRNPYDNSHEVRLNLINDYIRGEELQQLKNSFPTFEILDYKIRHLPKSKRDEFFVFYKLSAGMEMTLTDNCNVTWRGVILDKEITSENYGGGGECEDGLFYNLAFKFEGVIVP